MGLGVQKTLEEEIADLRASDRVDAELAELKRRLNTSGNREG
jgi:phage shock protein A